MTNNVPVELIQRIEFNILKYIRDVCNQNNLRYYLAYGTLIGAVRHQGFIPWDDDMDIHMPRDDYEKFVEIIKANPHPYYKLLSRETSPQYNRILAKMIDTRTLLSEITWHRDTVPLGLFIDIFVLDGAGNTKEEAEVSYKTALSIYRSWEHAVLRIHPPGASRRKSFKRWVKFIPEKIRGSRYWIEKHASFCMQKGYGEEAFVGAMAAGTSEASRNIWRKECFGENKQLLFMGEYFRVPEMWDEILRQEYGDYMRLPPLDQQCSNHRFNLTILDPTVLEP